MDSNRVGWAELASPTMSVLVGSRTLLDTPFNIPRNLIMDKKAKKRIDVLNTRITNLRQQLAGARKQMDDAEEVKNLEKQLAAAEAELAKAKEE